MSHVYLSKRVVAALAAEVSQVVDQTVRELAGHGVNLDRAAVYALAASLTKTLIARRVEDASDEPIIH